MRNFEKEEGGWKLLSVIGIEGQCKIKIQKKSSFIIDDFYNFPLPASILFKSETIIPN